MPGKEKKDKDKKRRSSEPSTTLGAVVEKAQEINHKKKVKPTAAAPPKSIGDSLKDELRAQQKAKTPPPVAAWETDENAPLPRGGGSALAPLEYKAIVASAREEVLFDASMEDTNAPDKLFDDGVGGAAATTAAAGSELVRAHSLHRKTLTGGVRALCAISDIASDRLLVQLPGRILGRIGREEVSDELYAAEADGSTSGLPDLRKLFKVGEVLCCAVLPTLKAGAASTAKTKGTHAPPVELTLRLSIVQRASLAASPRLRAGHTLWGTVKSAEEYGWVIETGTPSGGFLHKSKWLKEGGGSAPSRWRPHLFAMQAGMLQQPRKPLQLAAVGASFVPRPLGQETAYKFEGLHAGMLVEAQVREAAATRHRTRAAPHAMHTPPAHVCTTIAHYRAQPTTLLSPTTRPPLPPLTLLLLRSHPRRSPACSATVFAWSSSATSRRRLAATPSAPRTAIGPSVSRAAPRCPRGSSLSTHKPRRLASG